MTTTGTADVSYAPLSGVQGLLIGEDRLEATSGGRHEHVFPGTGEVNAEVALAGAAEVDRAVTSGAAAQRAWMAQPVDARRDALLRFADVIQREAAALNLLSIADFGVPKFIVPVHSMQLERYLRYYAGWIDKDTGQIPPVSFLPDLNLITYEPYGVVAVIVPWNGPLCMMGQAVVPALAAGNAVVVKPPEIAPLASLRFGELALEAGLPPGLVNVLPGDAAGGEALVRHPGIGKIHFTGSGPTARKIIAAAAENLTPVATELGGKSAHLVFDDVNLDEAAALAAFSGPLAQSGQSCACGSRILVQDSIYDEFVSRLIATMETAPIGDPYRDDTIVGPVISEPALTRILGAVDAARGAGATVLTGGARVGGELAGGYYIAPTLLAGVDNNSPLARTETFGPVVSVTPFRTEDEAVAIANDTVYGLVNYVQTHDLRRAHRVAQALQSGSVFVNTYPDLAPTAPYGGYKQSGQGRVGGHEGLREFMQTKNTRISMTPPALPS